MSSSSKDDAQSIAASYSACKPHKIPKSLNKAINQLKRNNDIVITKPDKGSGVVIMDKTEYLRILSEASVSDTTKFSAVSKERPKTRGRFPKYYHPLLQKEKELEAIVRRILPKEIADTVCLKGSHLAHLYGLPKTQGKSFSTSISSSTATYNYPLPKWVDDKLKTLSINNYTITDPLMFAEQLKELSFDDDILVYASMREK